MLWGMTAAQKEAIAKGYVAELWFAWHPVKLFDGRWCWLDYVWRKWECDCFTAGVVCGWTYSTTHF